MTVVFQNPQGIINTVTISPERLERLKKLEGYKILDIKNE